MSHPELILHHYPTSPFSEKVRLVFGMKALDWASVFIPPIMPKPDFTPLTGGYRKTPAMQVGSDIYCDTRLIIDWLEQNYPENSVYGGYPEGMVKALVTWAEDQFFFPFARYMMAINADHVGSALHDDRAAMLGNAPQPLDRIKAAAPRNLPQMHIQLAWVESMLAQNGPYLLGSNVSLADIAVYHSVWFLGMMPVSGADQLTHYPRLLDWMKQVEQIGHGTMSKMDSKQALAIAAESTPKPFAQSNALCPSGLLHRRVGVKPADYGVDVVEGTLVYEGSNHITLLREQVENLGDIAVHFPQQQYLIKPIK